MDANELTNTQRFFAIESAILKSCESNQDSNLGIMVQQVYIDNLTQPLKFSL
jgi:hypothetical protein